MQLDRPPSQCISYAQITCQDAEDDHRLDLDDAIYDGGANDVDVLLSGSNRSALDSPQLTYRLLKVTIIRRNAAVKKMMTLLMSVMVIAGDDDEIAKTSKCFDSDKADSDTVRCVKQGYRLHGPCEKQCVKQCEKAMSKAMCKARIQIARTMSALHSLPLCME